LEREAEAKAQSAPAKRTATKKVVKKAPARAAKKVRPIKKGVKSVQAPAQAAPQNAG